jgi:meso-butanediol dehydrogenase/(S,S)-butanediol dehydrogenase/diacetyl reductase
MYDDLKGKVVVITGSGRPHGLGQGMAKRFAVEGCRVVVSDLARPNVLTADNVVRTGEWEDLLQRKQEIEALGAGCLAVKCNVMEESEIQAMIDATVAEFGRVDILINNVGGAKSSHTVPLIEVDAETWDDGITLNSKGTHLCSRAFAKQMIKQGQGGKIVNIASQAAVKALPGLGIYCAAKAAVYQYTKVLALELAPHKINVNAVLPGTIMTDQLVEVFTRMAEKLGLPTDDLTKLLPPIPWGRVQTADDVAAAVLWLSSKESDYVTGEGIVVTGGQTIA